MLITIITHLKIYTFPINLSILLDKCNVYTCTIAASCAMWQVPCPLRFFLRHIIRGTVLTYSRRAKTAVGSFGLCTLRNLKLFWVLFTQTDLRWNARWIILILLLNGRNGWLPLTRSGTLNNYLLNSDLRLHDSSYIISLVPSKPD